DEDEFTRRACDPRASVVVEACAGSGKTWLLVARIIRALLAGVEPGEILAITFTRRAAQEVRARLLDALQELARGDDDAIQAFLKKRGLDAAAARSAALPARTLYERVATARVPVTIETFHGWFWQLLARAPLGAGVPFAPALLEGSDRVREDAWLHFTAMLIRDEHAEARTHWEWLVDELGDVPARNLLLQFLYKRAEWWSFGAGDEEAAVQRALAPLRVAGDEDPVLRVRAREVVEAMQQLAELLRAIAAPGVRIQEAIDRAQGWLQSRDEWPYRDFLAACHVVLTKELTPRDLLLPAKIARKLESANATRYAEVHAALTGRLTALIEQRRTWRALRLNEAGLACGRLLVEAYQRLKGQQQALDFTDIEWHAHRLLADPDNAAYMQVRLDARYRQVLLDEFQDTNPLQWQVLQAWLAGYGALDNGEAAAGEDRPRVFIVGDPKQSIYRFRRADPRVFDAARALLRRDFAATTLRTNVTRRNARAIVDVLNVTLAGGNPLYQQQRTRSSLKGAFVLLPLVEPQPAAGAAEPAPLRDVLTAQRAEVDREARYREGRVLANEIAYWVGATRVVRNDGTERAARWSDVLVLVRRRTHLEAYERALRDAGLPFVSDRRGGLLTTLEAEDLIALLDFLTSPYNDLRLAHALRSPVFGCTDDDLMRLASAPGATWWERLQGLEADASPALLRARQLLQWWLDLAGVLPVHDLLDRIYHEGDVRRRYAVVAPAALHAQVQANLDAFIELALAIDAGRYPSLPRFIDELANLKRQGSEEAPDEGLAASDDALRVMTIHGAKGLEAEVVVLADAHSRNAPDGESVLVVWPPEAPAPSHLSLVARGEAAVPDPVRAAWFAEDDAQRAQEDWNLLYVAATRARQVLIVSGTAPARGTLDDTWYARLRAAGAHSVGAAPAQCVEAASGGRWVQDFLPEPLPTGQRVPAEHDSEAMRLGRAWHAFLELGEAAPIDAMARAHALTSTQAESAAAAARRVRHEWPQFFDATAEAELELVAANGDILRVDRLVEREDAVWIIDFKWRVTEDERQPYEAQVRRYAQVLRSIRSDKPVRIGLVTAAGEFTEVIG
ncbi:MAG: UvrD-helicase domain-containing protein, partial [Betaproteobacteria bacterium]